MSKWWWCVACWLLLLGATQAHAQQSDTAKKGFETVVLTVFSKQANSDLAAQMTRVLRVETQRNQDYDLVDTRDLSLVDALALVGCEEPTPDCMEQLSQDLKVERIIFSQLTDVEGLQDMEVNVYDLATNRVVSRWNRRFSRDVDAIGFFAREMGSFLGGRSLSKPTALRISCNVPGAAVLVDGRRVGRTPYLGESFEPGRHDVVVTREGYTSWRRNIELVEGEGRLYSVTLRPLEGEGEEPEEQSEANARRDPLSTYGWVLLSTGGLLVGTGGVFGVLAGQTHDEYRATRLEALSEELRDRGELQVSTANVLYTVGGLSVLTGAVLLLVSELGEEPPSPLIPQSQLGLSPLPDGGAAVQWRGHW